MPGMRRRLGAVFACALAVSLAIVPAGRAGAASKPVEGRWKAAVLYDPQSGRFLHESRADASLPPASLTKMITGILAAERLRPDARIRISRRAAEVEVDSIRWPLGKRFVADDLLHAMMMRSSNGAAIALAEAVAGSVEAFLPLMDARARELGATHSRFRTPHGLDMRGQRSTARDLAFITTAVLRDPWLSRVVQRRVHRVPWPDGGGLMVYNSNRLMSRYRGAIGVKPGFTSQAGNSLAGAAMRGGRVMVIVILNDPAVYEDATQLLDTGFRLAPEGPAWIPPQEPSWITAIDEPVEQPGSAAVDEVEPVDPVTLPAAATAAPPAQRRGGGRALFHLVSWSLGFVALNTILGRSKPKPRRRTLPIRLEHAIEHAEQTLYADTQMFEVPDVAAGDDDARLAR